MGQAEWWSKNWAAIISVATVLGLGAMLLRAYTLAHGSSGYLFLLQNENFLKAALAVGLNGLVGVSFAVLVISLPMQFATMYEDWAKFNPTASILSLVVLYVFSTIQLSDLLAQALIAAGVLIVVETILWLLFRRFDIGSPSELYRRAESVGDRTRSRDERGRFVRSKEGRRGRKSSRTRVTDPARLASYKIAARRMVSFVSVLLAGAIGLSAVFASHTLWIPVERLTFEDESRVDGALVVEETPNWITYMTLADGTFATRNADEVARRTFCTYAWVKSAYEVEC